MRAAKKLKNKFGSGSGGGGFANKFKKKSPAPVAESVQPTGAAVAKPAGTESGSFGL